MKVPLEVAAYIQKLETQAGAYEAALRTVRRLGQREHSRRIIDEALGDTWEQEMAASCMTAIQLRRLLDRAGLSQRDAANALDISKRSMGRYCAGDSKIPKTVELALLYLLDEMGETIAPVLPIP